MTTDSRGHLSFSLDELRRIAPFIVTRDEKGIIRELSPKLAELFPDLEGASFAESEINADVDGITLGSRHTAQRVRLRGHWVQTIEKDEVFLGHADLLDQQTRAALALHDLPDDDPSLDLLILRDEHRAAMADAQRAIAALDEKQAFIQTILESVPVCLMIVDAETHTIVSVNEMLCGLFGGTPEMIVGRVCHDIICLTERGRCPITDLGGFLDQTERILVDSEGRNIPVLKTVERVMLNGRPHLLKAFVDLSEQKRLQSQLAHSRKLESLGQLAAGVAHEINTPIQFLVDNLSFAEEALQAYEQLIDTLDSSAISPETLEETDIEYFREELPAAFQQSKEGLEQISKIVRSLKEMTRSSSHGGEAVDINHVVESILTTTHSNWKDVAQIEHEAGDIGEHLVVDQAELSQAILNLLMNAVESIASENRDELGKISIVTEASDDFISFTISDDGPGVPPEVQPRLFDPFFTTKEVGRGTGQGLSLTHAFIVSKCGGELKHMRTEGRGATFRFRLPTSKKENGTTTN